MYAQFITNNVSHRHCHWTKVGRRFPFHTCKSDYVNIIRFPYAPHFSLVLSHIPKRLHFIVVVNEKRRLWTIRLKKFQTMFVKCTHFVSLMVFLILFLSNIVLQWLHTSKFAKKERGGGRRTCLICLLSLLARPVFDPRYGMWDVFKSDLFLYTLTNNIATKHMGFDHDPTKLMEDYSRNCKSLVFLLVYN